LGWQFGPRLWPSGESWPGGPCPWHHMGAPTGDEIFILTTGELRGDGWAR
jgi:hypothetical protein